MESDPEPERVEAEADGAAERVVALVFDKSRVFPVVD